MAFKASSVVPQGLLLSIKNIAAQIKSHNSAMHGDWTVNGVSAVALRQFQIDLISWRDQMQDIVNQGGSQLIQYAKDQENDQTYEIVTEFNNMKTEIADLVTQIGTVLPATLPKTVDGDNIATYNQNWNAATVNSNIASYMVDLDNAIS